MTQEELTLSLIIITVLLLSISLYTLWIRLDLWATKRALNHLAFTQPPSESPPSPGCATFFIGPMLVALLVSVYLFAR